MTSRPVSASVAPAASEGSTTGGRSQVASRLTFYWAMLVLRALIDLLWMDLVARRGFRAVRDAVRSSHPRHSRRSRASVADIVSAVRNACVLYARSMRCLVRSAVVTRLLRAHGIGAELVIGYQPMPIQSHAWVEVDGVIVSDRTQGQEHYLVIDRW